MTQLKLCPLKANQERPFKASQEAATGSLFER